MADGYSERSPARPLYPPPPQGANVIASIYPPSPQGAPPESHALASTLSICQLTDSNAPLN
ncbi:MAG: hypothetical protein ABW185_16035 [Sedimenticola sp.]